MGAGVPRLAMLIALLPLAVGAAAADDHAAGAVKVELNKLETAGDDCRSTMVVTNGGGQPLDSLKLDLVFFDAEGVVARRLAAELGPLVAGKTVVKTFPVAGMACTAMSRVLVNDVVACSGPTGPLPDCIARIEPSSRASTPFIK